MTTVLGVDGGGRKTYAVIVDAFGALLGAAAAGPSNWEMAGVDVARDAIAEAADGALANAGIARGAIEASVFGLAGVDWPSDVDRLLGVIRPLGFGGPCRILNDAFVALRAGTVQLGRCRRRGHRDRRRRSEPSRGGVPHAGGGRDLRRLRR